MYLLYTLLLLCVLPIFVARLYVRSLKNPAYRKRMAERFAFYRKSEPVDIWVHAVSLGEMIAITPMLNKLLEQKPNLSLLITTTTPSGSSQVQKHFSGRVAHVYFPYDLPWLVNRFLKQWQPKVALFMETEVWPNTLVACKAQGIQTMLVNARLSESSYQGYAKWQSLIPNVFSLFDYIAAQAEPDQKRFQKLGATHVEVLGSMKFDINLPEDIQSKAHGWRDALPANTTLLIAASTHPGEEEQILSVYQSLKQKYDFLKLILVPRHPERKQAVLKLCEQSGFQTVFRSEVEVIRPTDDVLLVDTMGELLLFYAMSDIVFVGGSLIPHGGHNLIEPCALGKATLSGPFVKNFKDLQRILEDADAAIYVDNETALQEQLEKLLENQNTRQAYAKRAQSVIEQQRGSLERQLNQVIALFGKQIESGS